MNINEWVNVLTGSLGFTAWLPLTSKSPENSLGLAIGVLTVLMGFGGRETVKEILQLILKNKES
ncbi:hypothetical protein SAMN02745150_00638 [Brevinema andersonii]|uniref:Uncharacterized protein n=1 Tax=Brevinema andersonii TaxID=34097 RepID=A0A1I1DKS3_BREAD|nr:hypothetical protein [Brevinema andersonii]SFB75575.1 hypothetical protein SAMN02745150_00638 [Brevinema andersonii]